MTAAGYYGEMETSGAELTHEPEQRVNEAAGMRLVVVSNRLPISLKKDGEQYRVVEGSGGLVTALAPVLRDRGGVWIGWPGAAADPNLDMDGLVAKFSKDAGYRLHPVQLSEDEVRGFYQGFSNEVIWPLFHGFDLRCNFQPQYWQTYLKVNRMFADVIAESSRRTDYVWVHDYHLMHVAHMLKDIGQHRQTGFFLHIPFPPADIFLKMPWRSNVIKALLEYDMVGFQTLRDRRNFLECVRQLLPGAKPGGRGPVVSLRHGSRTIRIGSFPIGIDFKGFAKLAASREVARRVEELCAGFNQRRIILGVDRLDYTKGIPKRLEAVREALVRYPDLVGAVNFVQIVVPSREDVPDYQTLKTEIERLVGEINGQFTTPGWSPIHYNYRSLSREELVAFYRAADMALITPLRDGMNLVAKEYVACNLDAAGILFLSEFAGAAAHFQHMAVLVNPYDVEGVAHALYRGVYQSREERQARMRRMRRQVSRYDIFWWVDSYLQAAFSKQLGDFPPMADIDYSVSDSVYL
jgi:trehalose 6-phosphate synthase